MSEAPGFASEQAVLGAILIDPTVLARIRPTLTGPHLFENSHHRTIFQTASSLERDGQPIDLVTVADKLKERQKLEECGGTAYLGQLVASVASTDNVDSYAANVVRAAQRRSAIAAIDGARERLDHEDVGAVLVDLQIAIARTWKDDEICAPSFYFQSVGELLAAPAASWTVHEILPDCGIGVIWGASGSGKTFAALDLGCAIVRGVPWHGRDVERGGVLYVATEGNLRGRIDAYLHHHGIGPEALDGLRILQSRINLLDHNADLPKLLERIRALDLDGIRLIVIDTLNRAMPGGNENASDDMGRMVDAATAIMEATGSTVMYVHHSGKEESKGSRGHSSLKAACDFELSVRRDGDVRSIHVEKVRDAEDGFRLAAFTLQSVGESVVLVPTDAPPTKSKTVNMTPTERKALDALNDVLGDRSKRKEATAALIDQGASYGQYVALIEDWRTVVYAGMGSDVSPDAKRQNFLRARERLTASHRVQIFEDHAWLRNP